MRDIRASAEVRALVGADKLRELDGDGFVRYECRWCGLPGRTTEATSVIIVGYRVFRVAMLAHAACADSRIIEVDADTMRAVARQTAAPQPHQQAREARLLACGRNHPARGCPA
jgi:hypothetical protein